MVYDEIIEISWEIKFFLCKYLSSYEDINVEGHAWENIISTTLYNKKNSFKAMLSVELYFIILCSMNARAAWKKKLWKQIFEPVNE